MKKSREVEGSLFLYVVSGLQSFYAADELFGRDLQSISEGTWRTYEFGCESHQGNGDRQ